LASSFTLPKEKEESGMHKYQGKGVMLEMVAQKDFS
jgi:hypothetical protein